MPVEETHNNNAENYRGCWIPVKDTMDRSILGRRSNDLGFEILDGVMRSFADI